MGTAIGGYIDSLMAQEFSSTTVYFIHLAAGIVGGVIGSYIAHSQIHGQAQLTNPLVMLTNLIPTKRGVAAPVGLSGSTQVLNQTR